MPSIYPILLPVTNIYSGPERNPRYRFRRQMNTFHDIFREAKKIEALKRGEQPPLPVQAEEETPYVDPEAAAGIARIAKQRNVRLETSLLPSTVAGDSGRIKKQSEAHNINSPTGSSNPELGIHG
jgi:hypothetical protein